MPAIDTVVQVLSEGEGIRNALVEVADEKRVLILSDAIPRPSVSFKYRSQGLEIPFEKASEGQRATVLLMMLLNQEGGPLVVDQPEGDLDNKVITRVVELLHDIKHKRQLIIASHNGNLVVNGAAELVGVMNNDEDGRRNLEDAGAIDKEAICVAITTNMEGGKEAFRNRQRKYGF